jgi:hypothetical protein
MAVLAAGVAATEAALVPNRVLVLHSTSHLPARLLLGIRARAESPNRES